MFFLVKSFACAFDSKLPRNDILDPPLAFNHLQN